MRVTDGKTRRVVAPGGGCVREGFYRISGFNGFALADAAGGADVVLEIDPRAEHQFSIPGAVTANLGDVLYVPPASGQTSAALTATATNNVPAIKVTKTKDADNIIWGYAIND